jgi:hypothetical protein
MNEVLRLRLGTILDPLMSGHLYDLAAELAPSPNGRRITC